MIQTKIKKIAIFTDIHVGGRSNSEQHNQDCLNFLEWFCSNVRNDPTINSIGFLGDWNENRSALNIATLNFSYKGAKMLNSLGLPVFFIIGNHDLYHRYTREIHSIVPFHEFSNFTVIEEPTIIENQSGENVLFCPYMFHNEYPSLMKYLDIPIWMGHFEFKGYEVTGGGIKMPIGPDPKDFAGPHLILSGHFHKRQIQSNNNIVYIGNAFPFTFGDADDNDRGMTTYDFTTKELKFFNWNECPKFIKTSLTDILDNTVELYPQSRVRCLVDIPITFEESTTLRQTLMTKYQLRELLLEESSEIREALSETKIVLKNIELTGIDELVEQMLLEINVDHISNQTLIQLYKELKCL